MVQVPISSTSRVDPDLSETALVTIALDASSVVPARVYVASRPQPPCFLHLRARPCLSNLSPLAIVTPTSIAEHIWLEITF